MTSHLDSRRLEELGLNSSAPPSQLLYDGWLLRLQPGQAKRARSVNPVYASSRPLDEKIAYCEQVYRMHALPMVFRITPFSQPQGLDEELERRGYPKFDATAVEVARIDTVRRVDSPAQAMDLVAWVDAVGELSGSLPLHRASHLARLQASPLQLRALAIRDLGHVVAAGLTIVEDGWAGLFDIVTKPAARRQGYGRQMVHGLLRAAWEFGARQAYLQVTASNTAARMLYAQLGFSQRYTYWYRGQSGDHSLTP